MAGRRRRPSGRCVCSIMPQICESASPGAASSVANEAGVSCSAAAGASGTAGNASSAGGVSSTAAASGTRPSFLALR